MRLGIAHEGTLAQVEVDRAVLAIPFSVLRHVQLDNSFSSAKRAAVAGLRYESATHVYLQTKSRFWQRAKLSGFVITDLPIGNVLDACQGQPGTAGVLCTEAFAAASRRATAMTAEERLRWSRENLTRVFPEMAQEFVAGSSVCWDTEPFARGAWAYYAPGRCTRCLRTSPRRRSACTSPESTPRACTSWKARRSPACARPRNQRAVNAPQCTPVRRAVTVPDDLDADAHEDEGREAHQHLKAGVPSSLAMSAAKR